MDYLVRMFSDENIWTQIIAWVLSGLTTFGLWQVGECVVSVFRFISRRMTDAKTRRIERAKQEQQVYVECLLEMVEAKIAQKRVAATCRCGATLKGGVCPNSVCPVVS